MPFGMFSLFMGVLASDSALAASGDESPPSARPYTEEDAGCCESSDARSSAGSSSAPRRAEPFLRNARSSWVAYADSGSHYYHNTSTDETSWSVPPEGVRKVDDEDVGADDGGGGGDHSDDDVSSRSEASEAEEEEEEDEENPEQDLWLTVSTGSSS